MNPSIVSFSDLLSQATLTNFIIGVVVIFLTAICYHLKFFFFPRQGTFPESYPFENTIRLLVNNKNYLDYMVGLFDDHKKATGMKTLIANTLGIPHLVLTTNVDNVTYILKTHQENFGKAGPEFKPKFQGLLGDGIFNVDGQMWYAHRKTSAHLFKLQKFKSTVLEIFNADINEAIEWIETQNGDAFDFHALMHRYTLETISKIAFGVALNGISNTNVTFAHDFDYCTMSINDAMINPLWMLERYFTPKGWKYFFCLSRLNNYALKMIKERRAEIAKNGSDGKNDLLTLYLDKSNFSDMGDKTDDTYIEPSDKTLRDVILNMIIAGRDTTAQALSWAFYRLCIHKHVYNRIREEVISVLGKSFVEMAEQGRVSELSMLRARSGKGDLRHESLQQLRYVEAFCMEVLRLYPSVPKEGKCVFKHDTLPDGIKVRPGDVVSFVPYAMGRDVDLWGADALEFKPERFLDNPKPSPFVFTAFQAGPRTCLGQNFAILEMKNVVARLCLCFEFDLAQAHHPTYDTSLTLPMRGGMQVKLKPIEF